MDSVLYGAIIGKIKQMQGKPLDFVNGVLYFRKDSNTIPVANDIRIRKDSQFLYFERYNGSTWEYVAKAGGSLITDKINLQGEFGRIENEAPNGDINNVWRLTSNPNGNEFGSSNKKIWLTANGKDSFILSYASDWHDTYIQNNATEELTGNLFEKNFTADENVELEYFAHNLYAETKAKVIIKDIAEDRIIYETMNDAEFIETGGTLLKDYATNATTGLINARLKHVAYLVKDREYKITIKTSTSGYKGYEGFPFLVNRGKLYIDEKIASREWVQETNSYKRSSTDSIFYLKGNSVEVGSIRAIVIDGKINYQELKENGWDIANVQDVKLGERGLLSERLDALENAREFKGAFDASGSITQLNNAQTGYYWIVSVAGTIGDKTLGINDMIICHTAIATPTDFTNFAIIPSTINTMTGATLIQDGTSGLVPKPLAGQQDKVLLGNGTWVSVPRVETPNNWSEKNKFISQQIEICNNFINGGIAQLSAGNVPNGVTSTYYFPLGGGTLAKQTDIPIIATEIPNKIATASALGSSLKYAKEDHVHGLDLATQSTQGAMSSTDKVKLDSFTAMDSTLPQDLSSNSASSAGTSNKPARVDHVHKINHPQFGYDLTTTSTPKQIYIDKFLTSGITSTTISINNIPWVYSNIDQAERSLPYWIQELSTFFKNLENDNQFDQLIGAIPSNFSIPYGSWGVSPNSSTDMDNAIVQGSGNYASEFFEFIVGKNATGTEIYSFAFTFASLIGSTYDTTVAHPFRIIYQTSRNVGNPNFQNNAVSAISNAVPRCSQRPTSYVTSTYGGGFPIMYEPITIEINK
ncbi:hypothetical protein [Clostridium senegalense]